MLVAARTLTASYKRRRAAVVNFAASRITFAGTGSRGAGDVVWRGFRRHGHAVARRGLPRAARVGAQDLREIPRRVLAQAGGGAGLPDRFRRGTDPRRVSRVADPGGIWRLRPAIARRRGYPGGDQRLRVQR